MTNASVDQRGPYGRRLNPGSDVNDGWLSTRLVRSVAQPASSAVSITNPRDTRRNEVITVPFSQALRAVAEMLAVFSSRPAPPVRYDGQVPAPHLLVRYANMIHLRAIYSRRLLLALRARVWCSAALRVAEAPSTFEREIVTILRTHGLKCHSGSSPKNDLDLTHRDGQEVGDGIAVQVRRAFRLAFQRDPTEREAAAAEKWVRKHDLVPLCRALFNANEFILVN